MTLISVQAFVERFPVIHHTMKTTRVFFCNFGPNWNKTNSFRYQLMSERFDTTFH